MIKFFDLHKATKKEKESQPDYRISFKTNDSFVQGGACWKKQDKNGNTYLSCKLADDYKESKGYHIAVDAPVEGKTAQIDEF